MANPLFRKNLNGGNNGNNYTPQPNGGRMGGRPPSKFDQIRQIIGMAKAFLDDPDSEYEGDEKLAAYYHCVVKACDD